MATSRSKRDGATLLRSRTIPSRWVVCALSRVKQASPCDTPYDTETVMLITPIITSGLHTQRNSEMKNSNWRIVQIKKPRCQVRHLNTLPNAMLLLPNKKPRQLQHYAHKRTVPPQPCSRPPSPHKPIHALSPCHFIKRERVSQHWRRGRGRQEGGTGVALRSRPTATHSGPPDLPPPATFLHPQPSCEAGRATVAAGTGIPPQAGRLTPPPRHSRGGDQATVDRT